MGERTATVKAALLLAVAAATPDWAVTAICLFYLTRLLGRTWEQQP